MPIAVTCPQCSRRHQAPDSMAGRQAKCGCGAVLSVPTPATPAAVVARPSGSWQSPAPAAPVPVASAGPSVFDDISPADLSRHKPHPTIQTTVAPPATAALSPSASNTSEYLDRARGEILERERTQAANLPHSVSLAIAGLAVPGALALFVGFGSLLALGSNVIEDFGSEFMIFMFVVCSVLAILDIGTGVLIYMRAPFARPLGYFAGAVTLCTCNPVNFICGIITLWFLSMPETSEYLRRKGALGVIDW